MLLTGPDRFFCAWVEKRYMDLIRVKMPGSGRWRRYSLSGGFCLAGTSPFSRDWPQRTLRLPGVPQGGLRLRSLHPAFTFDQFMVGESNILAQSQGPGRQRLYLWPLPVYGQLHRAW